MIITWEEKTVLRMLNIAMYAIASTRNQCQVTGKYRGSAQNSSFK